GRERRRAGGGERGGGLVYLGLVIGVLQPRDHVAPTHIGSLAHPQFGQPPGKLGGDRRPGPRDDVPVGRDAGGARRALRTGGRRGRDDHLHRHGAAATGVEHAAHEQDQRAERQQEIAGQRAAQSGRRRVPVDPEPGEIGPRRRRGGGGGAHGTGESTG